MSSLKMKYDSVPLQQHRPVVIKDLNDIYGFSEYLKNKSYEMQDSAP